MRSLGIVRKIDELGRITLPKELRDTWDIMEKDPLEVYTEDDKIILKKYEPGCTFCGSMDNITDFKGKHVCKKCRIGLKGE